MVVIGVDPHKRTHTAAAVDQSSQMLESLTIEASFADYRRLLRWADRWPARVWAVENARGLGRHLAQWLIARGETVHDVPSTATARVRELSRGGRRKNDVLDAAAAASVAALQGDAQPLEEEDATTVLGLLDERRGNLAGHRIRVVNQLHALLRDLLPGGAPAHLSATTAARLLTGTRLSGPVEQARRQLARDLIVELRGVDARLAANEKQMVAAVEASGSRLVETLGIGAILAARLLGRTGRVSRFPSGSAFASYCGAAPIEVSSGDVARHRLCRGGDRQLNAALYLIAMIQIRTVGSPGHQYFQRKLAEGKTRNEARRCLKRKLAEHMWRRMLADERARPKATLSVATAA